MRNSHLLSVFFFTLFFSKTFLFAQGSCASPDGSFFGFDGGLSHDYTSANANGWCYNNLTAGQTYCWTYFYPSSGSFIIDVILNETCGNCGGSGLLVITACSGGCASVGVGSGCGSVQYNSICAIQQGGGIEHGGNGNCTPGQTCGTNFTWCITIPAGCATMDVCPMVYCAAGPGNCTGIMPIELLSFTGKNECEKNIISWTSASETSNDYYTLERSTDAEIFSVTAIIDGAGNSSIPVKYEVIDQPEIWSTEFRTTYYRLKQTDFDGKSEIFKIIALEKDCGNEITISPTLTDGIILIHFGDNRYGNMVSVFDSMGRKIISSSIAKEIADAKIDLSNYAKGLYTVVIASEKETISQKVVLK